MSEIERAIEKKEYIERGALIDAVYEGDYSCVSRLIEEFPAADVEPVVRGEWLNFVGDYVTAECSVCGECYDPLDYNDKEHFDMSKQLYKYCPNCGAHMERSGSGE